MWLWTYQMREWDITQQGRDLSKVDPYVRNAFEIVYAPLNTRQIICCMTDSVRTKCVQMYCKRNQNPETHDPVYEWKLDIPRSRWLAALRTSVWNKIIPIAEAQSASAIPQSLIDTLFLDIGRLVSFSSKCSVVSAVP